MRSLCASLLSLALLGCGSAQPPAGPKHEVSASKEAKTPCPKERKRAQEARELVLGSTDLALSNKAAERVFAHAECEAKAVAALPTPAGSQDEILHGLRDMRSHVRDAENLFREVERYQLAELSARAMLGQAELKRRFADAVAAVATPADLDAAGASEFESELSEAVRVLRLEAELLQKRGCQSLADPSPVESCSGQ